MPNLTQYKGFKYNENYAENFIYAVMAKNAYAHLNSFMRCGDDDLGKGGWKREKDTYILSDGFGGSAFINTQGELVIAFAGTDENQEWFLQNLNIASGFAPPQRISATRFARDVVESITNQGIVISKITFTGHSLGGALAQIVADDFYNGIFLEPKTNITERYTIDTTDRYYNARNSINLVTFDAPGVYGLQDLIYPATGGVPRNIAAKGDAFSGINYYAKDDPIGKVDLRARIVPDTYFSDYVAPVGRDLFYNLKNYPDTINVQAPDRWYDGLLKFAWDHAIERFVSSGERKEFNQLAEYEINLIDAVMCEGYDIGAYSQGLASVTNSINEFLYSEDYEERIESIQANLGSEARANIGAISNLIDQYMWKYKLNDGEISLIMAHDSFERARDHTPSSGVIPRKYWDDKLMAEINMERKRIELYKAENDVILNTIKTSLNTQYLNLLDEHGKPLLKGFTSQDHYMDLAIALLHNKIASSQAKIDLLYCGEIEYFWNPPPPTPPPGFAFARDPIILDLDGDGIETTNVEEGIYFDLDANGYAEKTGWVKSDDGLLVLDRDGDGEIANGRELFGDQTRLNDGTIAISGFQALSGVDSNGDGKIDANDPVYSQLRVWRDLDGNGYSGAREMFTLEELGIKALNISNTLTNTTDSADNTQARLGSFEMVNGNTSQMGEYLFKRNTKETVSKDWTPVSSEICQLPDLNGWGNVSSLHQTMAKDMSGELENLVKMFEVEADPEIRNYLMDKIIYKWTGSDTIAPDAFGPFVDARKIASMESIGGGIFQGMGAHSPSSGGAAALEHYYQEFTEYFYAQLMSQTHCKELIDSICYIRNDDNEIVSSDMTTVTVKLQDKLSKDYEQGKIELGEFVRTVKGLGILSYLSDFSNFYKVFSNQNEELAWIIDSAGRDLIMHNTTGNDAVSTNIYGNSFYNIHDIAIAGGEGNDSLSGDGNGFNNILYGQQGNDALTGGSGNDILHGGADNDIIYGGAGNDRIDGGTGNDYVAGGIGSDTYIYQRGYGNDIVDSSNNTSVYTGSDIVEFGQGLTTNDMEWVRDGSSLVVRIKDTGETLTLKDWYLHNGDSVNRFRFADGSEITDNDIHIINLCTSKGTTGDDILYGNVEKDDEIYGQNGNDTIYGYNGSDILFGGDGNDYLNGGADDDVLFGESGQDSLSGGAGNDYLNGGLGDDVYLYGKGYGNDVIDNSIGDGSYHGNDIVRFAAGITANDIEWQRNFGVDAQSLLLVIKKTGETLTIKNWFNDNKYKVGKFQFADGVVLDIDAVTSITKTIGTAGNDYLNGSVGNDTYVYGRGSGNDVIDNSVLQNLWGNSYSVYPGNDVVQFGTGITVNDVEMRRHANDLIVTLKETKEFLTISGWFTNSNYQVAQFRFTDGSELSAAQIEARIICVGTEGNDTINASIYGNEVYGLDGNDYLYGDVGNDLLIGGNGDDKLYGAGGQDTLHGGTGNDYLSGDDNKDLLFGNEGDDRLYGGIGDDTLDGGSGNDYLNGGAGNDIYIYGKDSGNDVVDNNVVEYSHGIPYSVYPGNDVVQFGTGITVNDIEIRRNANDLIVTLKGTQEFLTISGWFNNNSYQVAKFQFVDGSELTGDAVTKMVEIMGSDDDDLLYGDNVCSQKIEGLAGDDTLYGYAGNDSLYGGVGNDILDGGTGNDYLEGGTGNDTYVYGKGSGNDIINNYTYGSHGVDVVCFGIGITANDIEWQRDDTNLIAMIKDTKETLTLRDWFNGNEYQVAKFQFSDGSELIATQVMDRVPILGTTDNDRLYASSSYGNKLYGLGGNDELVGNIGNDILDGGSGNDELYGGGGNDIYVYDRGDGNDTIDNHHSNLADTDIVKFGTGVTANDIEWRRDDSDLIAIVKDTKETLTVKNWFYDKGYNYQVAKFQFADGSELSATQVIDRISTMGTNGNDQLYASSSYGNELYGLDGNDDLSGYIGNDILAGGSGNDNLYGAGGNDIYVYDKGDGNDTINSYHSNLADTDIVKFGTGVTANDIEWREDDTNLIAMIKDTKETLTLQNWFYGYNYQVTKFQFSDGSELSAKQVMDRISTMGTNGDDQLYASSYGNELYGLDGNDDLSGYIGNDILAGGSGNDYLYGAGGNDIYVYNKGDGNDTINNRHLDLTDTDIIQFGTGITANDIEWRRDDRNLIAIVKDTKENLTLQYWFCGNDYDYQVAKFQFADGSELSAKQVMDRISIIGTSDNDQLYASSSYGNELYGLDGNDYLSGNIGNDILAGGSGNDDLYGADGNDIYVYDKGDGNDTINNYHSNSADTDIVKFGTGITANDIEWRKDDTNLIAIIKDTKEILTLRNWFYGNDYQVAKFQFSDGSELNAAQVMGRLSIIGTNDNDQLYASSSYGNELYGLDGDDYLSGYIGNDILAGGSGNDDLYGGGGNDIYVYNKGDGNDTINNYHSNFADTDIVKFGTGVTENDIEWRKDDTNLIAMIKDTKETLTLRDWFYGNDYQVTKFQFSDGSELNATQVMDRISTTGTNGNDQLYASSSYGNELYGLDGNDYLSGNIGNDILAGGSGNDDLYGAGGNDIYVYDKGDGNDTINNYHTNSADTDIVKFGTGITANDIEWRRDDTNLIAMIKDTKETLTLRDWFNGNDYQVTKFQFSDGSEFSATQVMDRVSMGTNGNDQLYASSSYGNELYGLDGNDYLSGNIGNDILVGGSGNDELYGAGGNDIYVYNRGDGNDTIDNHHSNLADTDIVKFGTGVTADDIEWRRDDTNLIAMIKDTKETLTLRDWFYGNDYQVTKFQFSDGSELNATQVMGRMSIIGTNGNDQLYASPSYGNELYGLDGDDYLQGNSDNNILVGGNGNDFLLAGEGDDVLDGGSGNDYLEGGTKGNDIYNFGKGYGNDIIYNNNSGNDIDIVQFGTEITANDITWSIDKNSSLIAAINDTGETLTLQNWFQSDNSKVSKFKFTDGSELTAAEASNIAKFIVMGTNSNDNLSVTYNLPSKVYGLSGNDVLYGGIGNDILYGGLGNDVYIYNSDSGNDVIDNSVVEGTHGSDIVRFGSGIYATNVKWSQEGDSLVVKALNTNGTLIIKNWFVGNEYRVDTFQFADGTILDAKLIPDLVKISDYNPAYNKIIGTSDNDIIQGGTGNDYLVGGLGNDTYIFDKNSGNDTIDNSVGFSYSHGNDIIQFGEGITDSDIEWKQSGWSLVGTITSTGQTLTINNWFYDDKYKVDKFRFFDGSEIPADLVMEMAQIIGTYGNDYLMGSSLSNDKINGMAGNDILIGYSGNDTLSGGDGQDQLHGGADNDLLFGGAGDDSLYGYDGDDTLDGGSGNDYLTGGLGNDIYIFDANSGNDTVDNSVMQGERGNDIVRLENIAAHDISWRQNGENLILKVNSTGQTLTINNWFCGNNYQVDKFIFADNIEILASQATDMAVVQGESTDDILRGSQFHDDKIYGMDGKDIIYAYGGNDIIDGGYGNDYMAGGGGNDSYIYGKGYGNDIIDSIVSGGATGNDTIQFGEGITASNIQWVRKDASQGLALAGMLNTGEMLTLTNMFQNDDDESVKLRFADGSELKIADIAGLEQIKGSDSSDSITVSTTKDTEVLGLVGNDSIYGNIGNDILKGGAGNDLLDGGAGNDYLKGGTGNDTYIYGRNYGNDVIDNAASDGSVGSDIVKFTSGITAKDILWEQNGEDLIAKIKDTGETVTISNWFLNDNNKNTKIQFADGSEFSASAVSDLANIIGTNGNDTIYASTVHGDKIYSLAGNDTIYAFNGNDHIDGGEGADQMYGGTGNDTYIVDNIGDNVIENANEGVDLVESSISYTLTDNVENLILTGSANSNGIGNILNNLIIGNSGDNILDGGSGADTLIGGLGSDTYVVDNLGVVVKEDINEGIDTVQASISYTLGANIENLRLTGSTNTNGIGNTLNNNLMGNSGDNVLDGGEGLDTLIGGTGNDTYIVDNIGDNVIENANEGIDLVRANVSYILSANVENLTLTGSADTSGTGNVLDNIITGNQGANILDGGAGNDTLIGGEGADTYVIHYGEGNDTIGYPTDATDRVHLSGSWSVNNLVISKNNNNLILTDVSGQTLTLENWYATNTHVNCFTFTDTNTAYRIGGNGFEIIAAPIIGNDADNNLIGTDAEEILYGLGGNDTLNGGLGNDRLVGGSGNDTYIIDDLGDVVVENPNEGIDRIQASINYTLSDNVENLTLTGMGDISGIGNTLNNLIVGNCGNNTLDGGQGADTLVGGLGNDTYIVDNSGDVVVENAAEGIDTVQSAIDYVLGNDVENLILTGYRNSNGTGNALNNIIIGNSGANILDGGEGLDTLIGGIGDDVYILDDIGDSIVEKANEGIDLIKSNVSYTLGANIENLTLTGTADVNGTGNILDNTIIGNSGNNILDGGAGNDTLIGGDGNNIFSIGYGQGNDSILSASSGDTVHFYGGWRAQDITLVQVGTNLVLKNSSDQSLVLLDWYTIENPLSSFTFDDDNTVYNIVGNALQQVVPTIYGTEGDDNLIGTDRDEFIFGLGGNDILDGGIGADTLDGGLGNDTYIVDNVRDVVTEAASAGTDTVQSSINYTLGANVENLTLTGTSNSNGTGNELNNIITGNSGDNVLDGGVGADTMIGGAGNDTYVVDNVGDVVTENVNEGTDIVQSSITYTLGNNVENLTLTGIGDINGTGNSLNNIIIGNSGDNVFDGGSGADTMLGGAGNDTYVVDNIGDIVTENASEGTDIVQSSITHTLGNNVENLILTGTGNINGTGNSLNNIIIGNSGDNMLDGGDGVDTMTGGLGNDTYIVDNIGDVVNESADEGTDTVQSSINYTLGGNVENLVLAGTSNLNGTGNELANALTGNSSDNILDGGVGADAMTGGLGNDTYVVDNTGDVVTENANEGTDIVQSSITYTLGNNVENLTLTGTGNIKGTGNSLNNIIIGNSGDNMLDGGDGIDTMAGGLGNDTYIVDNIGDVVNESADEGNDTVQSSINYTLGANVESLILTGTSNINGTGNALVNALTGNSGDNILNGGVGADIMTGGAGNDTYVVDNVGDIVTENATEGADTVQASVNYTLGANVENLVLTGTSNLNGTGNELANALTGNSGDNILDGGAGADTMIGGAGNDIYVVDNTDDAVTEMVNEGTDLVQSSITYTLGDNVENLTLTGTGNVNGTGNSLGNVIAGNSGNNILDGGAGNDALRGGLGDDTYLYGIGSGNDTINSYEGTGGNGNDKVQFGQGLTSDSFNYQQSGQDLILQIKTSGETLTFTNWFNGADYQVESFLFADSSTMTAAQVTSRVSGGGTVTVTGTAGNDTLNGTVNDDMINGLGGKDILYGNNGNDTLDGGAGADTMVGGTGNDTYFVDNSGDVVTEKVNEGNDTVNSSITYTLANNVENLILTGKGKINGTGNSLDNVITGNSGNNVLDGGAGADRMAGGLGNDTYFVDNIGDVINENVNEGYDVVQSSINYTLSANVEELYLTGTANINGTGNELDNYIEGNDGNNILIGGAGNDTFNGGLGADTLIGGTGDEYYIINDIGDIVIENVNEGWDAVASFISYTLSDNVEELCLKGTANINGTGNNEDNLLTGNSGNNILIGEAGNDTLYGGAGNDILEGGLGDDVYIFGVGSGNDVINSYVGANADNGFDTLQFEKVTLSSMLFTKNENDLICTINQTGETVRLSNWLLGEDYQVDQFKFSDGKLTANQISQKIV